MTPSTSARPAGSFWPSRTQELLLRTALAKPEARLDAWQQLGPEFDLRTLEPGTVSVLPLVYRNLSRGLPDDPRIAHLKGVYRNAWVKNNLLAEQLALILAAFDSAGVETVLIGSLAAAVRYFDELGLRPTPALDFLLDPEAVVAASRALGRLGWSASAPPGPDRTQPLVLGNAHGQTCVLRAAAAVELSLGLRAFQASAVAVEVGRCTVPAPSPAHDLLAVCVSGARAREVQSVQWLVDMAQIARSAMTGAEWDNALRLAAEEGQTLRLAQSAGYLSAVLDVGLPAPVTDTLRAPSVPLRERVAYRCAGARVPALGSFPQAISEHLVATRRGSAWRVLAGFPGFMRRRWRLETRRQLFIAGGRRAIAHATGREHRAS